jgi:hypothetical protein
MAYSCMIRQQSSLKVPIGAGRREQRWRVTGTNTLGNGAMLREDLAFEPGWRRT